MKVGDIIPDFSLKNQNNEKFHFYDIKDKMILLSFHPLAWTDVCAKQMQSLEENFDVLSNFGVLPVGISVDSDSTKKAWAEELGIEKTQLLADFWPHGNLAKKLGILDEQKGVSSRVNILVAENKEILFMKIYELSVVPNIDEITDFIKRERRKGREL